MEDKVNKGVINSGERVIVSKTGKIKQNGTVTIDGVKYTVGGERDGQKHPYVVTGEEEKD